MENERPENPVNDSAGMQGTSAPPRAAALLTTEQAAQFARVDPATIRRWKKKRWLTALASEGGRGDCFTLEQVRMVVERRTTTKTTVAVESAGAVADDGELAADLFAAFDSGQNPVDIVKKRKLSARVVEAFHAQWERLRGRRDAQTRRPAVPGELAAKIFHCFEMEWTLSQLVVEFQVTPDLVRKLWIEYRTPLQTRPR